MTALIPVVAGARGRGRAGRVAAVLLALATLPGAGCASHAPVELSNDWPSKAGDYREVTRTWTRHGRKRSGLGDDHDHLMEQTLDVRATFKSPEWRAASIAFRARRHKLPPIEIAALTERERADAAANYEVALLVSTYDRRANDLQKGIRSIWRVALVDDAGAEILPTEIKRDRRPRSQISADYPHLGDFHQAYVARFPRTVDLMRPGARRFSLKVTSALAGVELIWAEGK